MAEVTLTVVVPTIGRPSLAKTLRSLAGQDWESGDAILLVGDGVVPAARELWDQFRLPGEYRDTGRTLGHWGHGVRNWVAESGLVRTSHQLALDDDDVYVPGAIRTARAALAEHPDVPHIFRMDWIDPSHTVRKILWQEPVLREGNLGTPCFAVPTALARGVRWSVRYAGDFDFIRAVCQRVAPVWRSEILCHVRPGVEPKPMKITRYKPCRHKSDARPPGCTGCGDDRRICNLGKGTDGVARHVLECQTCEFYEVQTKLQVRAAPPAAAGPPPAPAAPPSSGGSGR